MAKRLKINDHYYKSVNNEIVKRVNLTDIFNVKRTPVPQKITFSGSYFYMDSSLKYEELFEITDKNFTKKGTIHKEEYNDRYGSWIYFEDEYHSPTGYDEDGLSGSGVSLKAGVLPYKINFSFGKRVAQLSNTMLTNTATRYLRPDGTWSTVANTSSDILRYYHKKDSLTYQLRFFNITSDIHISIEYLEHTVNITDPINILSTKSIDINNTVVPWQSKISGNTINVSPLGFIDSQAYFRLKLTDSRNFIGLGVTDNSDYIVSNGGERISSNLFGDIVIARSKPAYFVRFNSDIEKNLKVIPVYSLKNNIIVHWIDNNSIESYTWDATQDVKYSLDKNNNLSTYTDWANGDNYLQCTIKIPKAGDSLLGFKINDNNSEILINKDRKNLRDLTFGSFTASIVDDDEYWRMIFNFYQIYNNITIEPIIKQDQNHTVSIIDTNHNFSKISMDINNTENSTFSNNILTVSNHELDGKKVVRLAFVPNRLVKGLQVTDGVNDIVINEGDIIYNSTFGDIKFAYDIPSGQYFMRIYKLDSDIFVKPIL